MEKFSRFSKIALPLAIVTVCLFGYVLRSHSGIFRELQAAVLSVEWMLLACLVVWCGTFIYLTFNRTDWSLIGLLLIGIATYYNGFAASSQEADIIILLAGVTLGSGARVLAGDEVTSLISNRGNKLETPYVVSYFLIGLVVLLTFSAWWHLSLVGTYHGPRWMGLWNNPNIYGMLMGAGVVLVAGLLLADTRWKIEDGIQKQEAESGKRKFSVKPAILHLQSAILCIAAGMLLVGLVMSYSRGAWLGAAIGLLYLAWCYGKLKWRYVLPVAAVIGAVVLYHWGSTIDSAPWYAKRADLGRPSAQNRATAWRAGLEIMRDHPFGVGWNNAVKIYGEKYSPPEGGAAALTTNDYLMLGTELGIPALLCFVAYVGLCYRKSPRTHLAVNPKMEERDNSLRADQEFMRGTSSGLRPPSPQGGEGHLPIGSADSADAEREKYSPVPSQSTSPDACHASLRAACLAGAMVFVVAFWFDGGLFKLPTATMFWVLLELGAYRSQKVESGQLRVESPKAA